MVLIRFDRQVFIPVSGVNLRELGNGIILFPGIGFAEDGNQFITFGSEKYEREHGTYALPVYLYDGGQLVGYCFPAFG